MAYTSTGTGTTWQPTGSLGRAASYPSVPAATVAPASTVIAVGSTAAGQVSQQPFFLEATAAGAIRPVPLGRIPGAVVPEVSVNSHRRRRRPADRGRQRGRLPGVWRKTAGGPWRLVSSLSLVSAGPGPAAR